MELPIQGEELLPRRDILAELRCLASSLLLQGRRLADPDTLGWQSLGPLVSVAAVRNASLLVGEDFGSLYLSSRVPAPLAPLPLSPLLLTTL